MGQKVDQDSEEERLLGDEESIDDTSSSISEALPEDK